jgi:hypothetical protein
MGISLRNYFYARDIDYRKTVVTGFAEFAEEAVAHKYK